MRACIAQMLNHDVIDFSFRSWQPFLHMAGRYIPRLTNSRLTSTWSVDCSTRVLVKHFATRIFSFLASWICAVFTSSYSCADVRVYNVDYSQVMAAVSRHGAALIAASTELRNDKQVRPSMQLLVMCACACVRACVKLGVGARKQQHPQSCVPAQ